MGIERIFPLSSARCDVLCKLEHAVNPMHRGFHSIVIKQLCVLPFGLTLELGTEFDHDGKLAIRRLMIRRRKRAL